MSREGNCGIYLRVEKGIVGNKYLPNFLGVQFSDIVNFLMCSSKYGGNVFMELHL